MVRPSQFPSYWDSRSSLLMIDCGFDESGDCKTLIIGAVFGQTTHMTRLTTGWNRNLGLANVEYFHAKEHWNRLSKPYRRISIAKRKRLLDSLAKLIGRDSRFSIGVAINLAEFERAATPRFKNSYGSAYAFGINLVLTQLRLHLERERRTHEKINILLEEGHTNAQQALDQIRIWKKKQTRRGAQNRIRRSRCQEGSSDTSGCRFSRIWMVAV